MLYICYICLSINIMGLLVGGFKYACSFIPVQPRGSVLVMPLGAAGPWVVMQHVHAKRCLAYPTEKAARQTSTELFAMASKIFKSPECWNHIGEMNRSIQHSTNIHVSAGDISRLSMQCAIKLQCHYDPPYLRRFSPPNPPNPNQISGCSRCLKPPVFLVSAWEQLVFNHV